MKFLEWFISFLLVGLSIFYGAQFLNATELASTIQWGVFTVGYVCAALFWFKMLSSPDGYW